jgi:glycosyltransferase involved in cell wall biosynthesis
MAGALDSIQVPDIDTNPGPETLPKALLYATSAGIGGTGLDNTALQATGAAHRRGILGRALCFDVSQSEVPRDRIRSLAWHPVRALSFLESQRYYGAKKRYADWVGSRELATGSYDCFHGWSEDCLRTLFVAKQKGIPTLLDIPTWHRNKGKTKPFETKSEREARAATGLRARLAALPASRQRTLLEYDLADVILVQSERAAESFLDVGTSPEKVFYVARGVDPELYKPTTPPDHFRLLFVGALIKRKGVHHILQAWNKLNLSNAELVLVGSVHDEIKDALRDWKTDSVTLAGFSNNVREEYMRASAFVFPSECEGSAKVCYEAAACSLPQINTREAGDVVVDGYNGLVVPPNHPKALADAIRTLYDHPEKLGAMGSAGRERILERFTWEHHHTRLIHAYAYAMTRASPQVKATP